MSSYQNNQIALFRRNPHWYGPKPHIDGFGIQFFSDPDALVQALKTGAIDAVASPAGVPPTSAHTLQVPGIHVYTGPSLTWPDFIINANTRKANDRELLNPLVRKAFEYAVDRNQIIKTAYLGYAQPGASIIPPGTRFWHDPSIRPLPFDLAKANALLNQAGYKMGPGGIRVANGHQMSYTVIFASDQTGPGGRAFQIIQADYRKIGVRLAQRTLDATAATIAMLREAPATPFDVAMWAWITLIDPDYMLAVPTCPASGGSSTRGLLRQGLRPASTNRTGRGRRPIWRKRRAHRLPDAGDDLQRPRLHRARLSRHHRGVDHEMERVRGVAPGVVGPVLEGKPDGGPPGIGTRRRNERGTEWRLTL